MTVVKSLAKNCLYRQEDWWMYEICFNTGIRQMHARSETVQQGNGVIQHMQIIDDQYSLGEAPVEIYSNITALMIAAGIQVTQNTDDNNNNAGSLPDPLQPKDTTNVNSDGTNKIGINGDNKKVGKLRMPPSGMPVAGFGKDDAPKFLSLDFKNGTACDIESLNRSTTVQIHCGARELIMDILEDRTCHYTIKVSTPLLCLHAAFAPTKQAIERFVFTPLTSLTEEQIMRRNYFDFGRAKKERETDSGERESGPEAATSPQVLEEEESADDYDDDESDSSSVTRDEL
jgi:hypothetical protein